MNNEPENTLSSDNRTFGLLLNRRLHPSKVGPLWKSLPHRVPFKLVAAHEEQAQRNHGQSLTRLNQRGGLFPCEMLAVIRDRKWEVIEDEEAARQLLALLNPAESTPDGLGQRERE